MDWKDLIVLDELLWCEENNVEPREWIIVDMENKHYI